MQIETVKKSKGVGSFRMTERELELLGFVLEMKFASVPMLFERFYSFEDSSSDRYAYERINLLRKHGYLRACRVYTEAKTYYLATKLAYNLLSSRNPSRTLVKPIDSIDIRYFEHDKHLAFCRIAHEKAGRARDWVSERRLKHDWGSKYNSLARSFMPDAIYTNKQGDRVAFELEISPKGKMRHLKKILQFAHVIQNPQGIFRRVLFVAFSPAVHATLTELTRGYGKENMWVMTYQQLTGGNDA
jgi:hypothetical protein